MQTNQIVWLEYISLLLLILGVVFAICSVWMFFNYGFHKQFFKKKKKKNRVKKAASKSKATEESQKSETGSPEKDEDAPEEPRTGLLTDRKKETEKDTTNEERRKSRFTEDYFQKTESDEKGTESEAIEKKESADREINSEPQENGTSVLRHKKQGSSFRITRKLVYTFTRKEDSIDAEQNH